MLIVVAPEPATTEGGETPEIDGTGFGAATVIGAELNLVVSCVEVAVQLPLPPPAGVNRPPAVIVPFVAVHVTAELKAPVPTTVAVQVEV